MRCRACNVILTDQEAVKKDKQTGEFLDMCLGCLYGVEDSDDYIDLDAIGFYVETKEWQEEDT